jgi:hypothetical protein
MRVEDERALVFWNSSHASSPKRLSTRRGGTDALGRSEARVAVLVAPMLSRTKLIAIAAAKLGRDTDDIVRAADGAVA